MPAKSRGTVIEIHRDVLKIVSDHGGAIKGRFRNIWKGDPGVGRRALFHIAVDLDGKVHADEIEILPLSKRAERRVNPQPISSTTESSDRDNPDKKPPVSSTKILSGC